VTLYGAEDDVGPSAIGQNGKAMQGGGREAEAVMAVRKAVGGKTRPL
jgi:hypothetical protein